jgi:hypothetical protein
MTKLLTLTQTNTLGSRDQLGLAWTAAFLGVALIIAVAVWAAISWA